MEDRNLISPVMPATAALAHYQMVDRSKVEEWHNTLGTLT